MSTNFKKCPNGHYYDASLSACPYCPSANAGNNSQKTQPYVAGGDDDGKTQPYFEGGFGDPSSQRTIVDAPFASGAASGTPSSDANKTQFFDGAPEDGTQPQKRNFRKLVGWLVSYTIDESGVDFRLYEGRNVIGRDSDCQIVIPDMSVTGRHAILLFRNGKYSITDQQSSNGTYVNDEDIELEPRYIQDGDIIRIGDTILKFRSSF
jgi:hypothetical protein